MNNMLSIYNILNNIPKYTALREYLDVCKKS